MIGAPETPDEGFDVQAFAALDGYCEALRAGHEPGKDDLIKTRPDLAGVLNCLQELNQFARSVGSSIDHAAETIAPDSLVESAGSALEYQGRFGSYELLGMIGRGGMGVVYKARQSELDRTVAVKMILASRFISDDQLRRFQAEARAMAGLSHPYIVQVYEAGCQNGQHFFAMQYVDGPSLSALLALGPIAPRESAHYLACIARAAAYLHEHGIVHRDLKPANILLQKDEGRRMKDEEGAAPPSGSSFILHPSSFSPKITDFGLVKMLEGNNDWTTTGAILGTPSYMAPEQAAGRNADVGPLSDVYSLGAILYEMLTGRPPFHEATPFDTLVQVLESEAPVPRELNPDVPRALELICLKALAKSPGDRYASAAALADDIDRHLRGEMVQAQPQGVWRGVVRWVRQEPGLAARLAALGVSAGIAQVYYQLEHPVSLLNHLLIMAILGIWALASCVCQAFLRRGRYVEPVRLIWIAADAFLLTGVLIADQAFYSALALTYGVFIAGSGLWFRVYVVWFTTALACVGYLVLVLCGMPSQRLGASPQHHLIVLVGLAILGWMVATQIERVRALSRFYERRPMP
jgi:serine/threonine protein kinase